MDAILGLLGFVLVCVFAILLLAMPHLIEGVVHLYAPSMVGAFALQPLGGRDVREAPADTRRVPEGYRGTKDVTLPRATPGLEPGVWVIGPADGAHSRVTIVSARTALVTVVREPGRPLPSVQRGLATIRIRIVETGDGRRFHASCILARFGVPLAIPGYPLALALYDGGGGDLLRNAVIAGLVVLVAWQAIGWTMHGPRIRAAAESAMDLLEKQLVESALTASSDARA